MKKTLLTLSFFTFVVYSYSQDLGDHYYDLNFEDPPVIFYVIIDSVADPQGTEHQFYLLFTLKITFYLAIDKIDLFLKGCILFPEIL